MEDDEPQPKLLQRQEDDEPQPKLLAIQKMDEEDKAQPKLAVSLKGEDEEAQPKRFQAIQKQDTDEDAVQPKAEKGRTASSWASNRIRQTKGSGFNMNPSTRKFMESRFNRDFGKVRIHNDSTSHALSQNLGAQAFTVGNDIYFNRGKFDPDSSSGKKLLAHELTHTVQQTGGKSK